MSFEILQEIDEILDHIEELQSKVYDQVENYETKFPQDYEKLEKMFKLLKVCKPKIEKNLKDCSDMDVKVANLLAKINSTLNPDESNCLKWSKDEVTRLVENLTHCF